MYIINDKDISQFKGLRSKKKFIYTTYASVHKLHKHIKPDLVVYDEAHHMTNKHIFNNGIQLYLTATPGHLNPDSVIGKYGFTEAINDGVLTNYKINIFHIPTNDDACEYNSCLRRIMNDNNKLIVYCSSNLKSIELYENYNTGDDNNKDIKKYHVKCTTSKSDRKQIYERFRTSQKAVIFNCSILGEGVDFPECDSVFVHSGYVSDKRVVQVAGRPLRLFDSKQVANIYILNDSKIKKRLVALNSFDSNSYSKIQYITV